MPGPRKAARKRLTLQEKNQKVLGDITINDFANSSCGNHARLKKATTNVSCEVKKIMVKHEDTRAWDEKLDDFEGDFELVEQENEHGEIEVVLRTDSKSCVRTKLETPSADDVGVQYPLDVWFLISEYVQPEDVGRFAGICKSTFHVVRTAKFWFHLYKRFYKSVAGLPERLQPECMVRMYGLRACVIRTLHYSYFPQRQKVWNLNSSLNDEPHSLLKRQCCLMWHQKGKNQWFFFFKLKEIPKLRNISYRQTEVKPHRPDLIEMLEDVFANPEDNCRICRITCLKYTLTPLVTGLTLQSVSMTLSPGYCHHRLQLGFGTGVTPRTPPSQMVILDGVVDSPDSSTRRKKNDAVFLRLIAVANDPASDEFLKSMLGFKFTYLIARRNCMLSHRAWSRFTQNSTIYNSVRCGESVIYTVPIERLLQRVVILFTKCRHFGLLLLDERDQITAESTISIVAIFCDRSRREISTRVQEIEEKEEKKIKNYEESRRVSSSIPSHRSTSTSFLLLTFCGIRKYTIFLLSFLGGTWRKSVFTDVNVQ